MNIEKIYHKELEYKFLVKIDKQDVEKKVENFLEHKAKSYKKPGFRPGKVPLSVVKKDIAPDAYSEFLYHEIRNGYSQALKDHAIKPIRDPQIKQIEDNGNFHQYEMTVEQMPEFDLQDFSKITIKKLNAKLPEKQLEEFIEKLQKIHGSYEEVSRKSKKGDFVTVHYTVLRDQQEIEQLKNVEDIIEIDEKSEKNSDLIKELLNRQKGDTFSVEREGSIYHLEEKTVTVSFSVDKVETCTPAELNDDFYKKLDAKDLNDLKKKLSVVLSQSTDRMTNMYLKRQLLDALNNAYTFDIPSSMIEDEKRTIQQKISDEEKRSGQLDEAITEEELDKLAKRRVRLGILIGKVAEQHNLSVSKEMLMGAMYQSAQNYGKDAENIIKQWVKNQNIVSFFKMQLLELVVIEFLLKQVKIDEKEVTAQELYKEVEEILPDEVYDVQ